MRPEQRLFLQLHFQHTFLMLGCVALNAYSLCNQIFIKDKSKKQIVKKNQLSTQLKYWDDNKQPFSFNGTIKERLYYNKAMILCCWR